ncbi:MULTISPECIES: hypothetical protein [unclassified Oceanispirochaeta]|uniref:hypothetical protein n=1 Tax=unclassified Oceanispirochaeta TaxID=2635722 RepID=UPI000E09AAD0|nr:MULTISPECIES: hypothetical protein [unclassified Oceanispirochaeta]MBF9016839.1 hypothetical protein [Oceanispirochaeta sp. M2]NPD73202.1 hypothetical protein [Oceanispirochaeta sp. M1]RDG31070.1 hypothetical protein DV872_13960 [Oceanispirochaeta sp. M1]
MKKLFPFSAFTGLLILLFSCSGSPPTIINTDWMVVYTKDFSRGGVYAELNFFAQLEDSDGIEDISEISIHRDDLGWSWNLNPDNWVSYSVEGESWLGSNGLTRGGSIPGGDYRLLIVDRSGQRNETVFKVSDPALEAASLTFPSLKVIDDSLLISTGGREPVVLWFYNDKGVLITEKYSAPGRFRIDEIISSEEKQIARWVMIYFQDEIGGYGLKSGPFLLAPEEDRAADSSDGKASQP